MQRIRTFACEDCGEPVTRRKRADKPSVCLECGIGRSIGYIKIEARCALLRARARRTLATDPTNPDALRIIREL